jgi:hypothetical protein
VDLRWLIEALIKLENQRMFSSQPKRRQPPQYDQLRSYRRPLKGQGQDDQQLLSRIFQHPQPGDYVDNFYHLQNSFGMQDDRDPNVHARHPQEINNLGGKLIRDRDGKMRFIRDDEDWY